MLEEGSVGNLVTTEISLIWEKKWRLHISRHSIHIHQMEDKQYVAEPGCNCCPNPSMIN